MPRLSGRLKRPLRMSGLSPGARLELLDVRGIVLHACHPGKLRCRISSVEDWEFAQFLERVSFSEYRANATSDDEAYEMRDTGEQDQQIRPALADKGYAPR